jgi:tetratricopeptide (TPR) repeat protein
LRIAEFGVAATHAAALRAAAPNDPEILALFGDALWASGLFAQAEEAYAAAVALDPASARAHHGVARVLASRGRLPQALEEAEAALRAAPNDAEIQNTVGYVHERMLRFDEAADAYSRYLALLSAADRADKVGWARSHINFLRSYSGKKPFENVSAPGLRQHTIPFRLLDDKVIVSVKLNGSETVDFTLDTGAEQTVVTAHTARRLGLPVMGETLSAGVGLVGMRGVQLSRLDSIELGTLKIRNVTCLIKNPPIEGLPNGELESLSPLAFGLSLTVDYKTRRLTIGEPDTTPAAHELPLRLHRLATVQGSVNGQPASFIVDTGGQVISLNTSTARSLFQPAERRRIALRVYGSSGLDPEAYLLPGVTLAFDAIRLPTQPVVVLNLRAPSILLGYQIGGIVGHKFLSKYKVEFDLQRSVLRLRDM